MDTRTFFLKRVDEFLARAGMTDRQLGQQAVGNPKIVQRVRRGTHVTTDTIERIERFIGVGHVGMEAPRPLSHQRHTVPEF